MIEKPVSHRENSEKRRRNIAKIFGAFLASLSPEAKAIEIPVDASWSEGAALLRNAVFEKENEQAAVFVISGSGESGWVYGTEGDEYSVTRFNDEIVESAAGKKLLAGEVKLCLIHTHPRSLPEPDFQMEIGPSSQDLYNNNDDRHYFDLVELGAFPEYEDLHALESFNITKAVFTPNGVWYHQSADYSARQAFLPAEYPNDEQHADLGKKVQAMSSRLFRDLLEQAENPEQIFESLMEEKLVNEFESDEEKKRYLLARLKGRVNLAYRGGIAVAAQSLAFLHLWDNHQEFKDLIKTSRLYMGSRGYWEGQGWNIVDDNDGVLSDEEIRKTTMMIATTGQLGRFVTYEDLVKEPACAGAEFQLN